MLEPLIVLTVLNCFFMFSSTVTTCALWWQYRTHRCCFKKDPLSTKCNLSKSKNNNNSNNNNSSKKTVHLKHDNGANLVARSKSNSTVNREGKSRRSSKSQKSRHQSRSKTPSDERLSSIDVMESWELEDRTRMSEASQTANADPKSAVVMEYSTMQKIVQILDNDTNICATKMVMRDLSARQNAEERKASMIESQFEPQPVYTTSEYTPTTQD